MARAGRTALTSTERAAINLATWPDLEKPFVLLERLFDRGWEAEWGEAGAAVQSDWGRSALSVDVEDASALIANVSIETEADWVKATDILVARLSALSGSLKPLLPPAPPPVPSRRTGRTPILPPPFLLAPTGRRMQESPA